MKTVIEALWIIAGVGIGIFISRDPIMKLHTLVKGEISETGAWIVLGGLITCAIASILSTRE